MRGLSDDQTGQQHEPLLAVRESSEWVGLLSSQRGEAAPAPQNNAEPLDLDRQLRCLYQRNRRFAAEGIECPIINGDAALRCQPRLEEDAVEIGNCRVKGLGQRRTGWKIGSTRSLPPLAYRGVGSARCAANRARTPR